MKDVRKRETYLSKLNKYPRKLMEKLMSFLLELYPEQEIIGLL